MYQWRHGLFGVLALTISSPLFAADMPYKAPMAAPVAASGWNGWYVGGQLGFKSVTNDWTTNCVDAGGAPLGTCGSPLSQVVFPGAPDSSASNRFTTSGFRYGLYAGAMSQVYTNWVVGIEGDVGFYNQSSTVPGILGCSTAACEGAGFIPPLDLSGDSTSVKNTYDYSVRLRAGYLVTPDILAYGTGGLAFQHVEASMACNGNTSPACNFSASQTVSTTLPGYTVGGGLEWKLMQNWLIRGEYRYSDYGTWKPSFFQNSGIIEVYPSIHVKSQMVTGGIAYMFPISR